MTNEEKTFSILQDIGLMSKELEGDYGKRAIEYTKEHLDYKLLMEMAAWKDEQLAQAIDKALEHHTNKLKEAKAIAKLDEMLKEGKITQYGMDNVFAFVQNVRTLLNSEL